MAGTVLLVDGSPARRRALRSALERRGHVVAGEAGSVSEIVRTVASLERAPATVLVGAGVGGGPDPVARLLKRAWPKATVIQEHADPAQRHSRRGLIAAAGV